MSTTCGMLCVKISSKSVHLTTRYCKVKVPYQSRQKRGEVTCRPKIDHLNYGKRPTKHIRGESSLSGQSKEPICGAKFVFFVGLTCTYPKSTGHELVKMGVCVLANFSKTAEKNKTPFTGIQVRLKLSSNQQTDQKSVYSTRRYSNIKVPYQMTKSPKYGSWVAKIHHPNYKKLHTKYIWGDSPLTEDSKH